MTEITRPVLMVNFKAYGQVEGPGSVKLALECQEVAEETGVSIAVCPPTVELSAVAAAAEIPVLAQSVDPYGAGSRTGWVVPSAVRACGCSGTLINHSEHPMGIRAINDCVAMCDAVGLDAVVCADCGITAAAVAEMHPAFVAVEPPELIGGDVSVTSADPKVVSETVAKVRRADDGIGVLCGAGVKTSQDVEKALELGADGVLLASGVVKAADWHAVLSDLASGFRSANHRIPRTGAREHAPCGYARGALAFAAPALTAIAAPAPDADDGAGALVPEASGRHGAGGFSLTGCGASTRGACSATRSSRRTIRAAATPIKTTSEGTGTEAKAVGERLAIAAARDRAQRGAGPANRANPSFPENRETARHTESDEAVSSHRAPSLNDFGEVTDGPGQGGGGNPRRRSER